jgi:2-keto-4-pentenoate hydratase/2-oxohepta-3-ene-1,7-dioic acid hydratase in catechol pathway
VAFNGDITSLSFRLFINKTVVQLGSAEEMITSPNALLTEAQTFLSVEDNDVLMTGTPAGVGSVDLGDVFLGQVFQDNVLLVEQQWVVV